MSIILSLENIFVCKQSIAKFVELVVLKFDTKVILYLRMFTSKSIFFNFAF